MAQSERAAAEIKKKLQKKGGSAQIPLLRGERSFTAQLVPGGVEVSNLGNQPFLPWKVFEEAVRLLENEGGRVSRGDAMKNKLGDHGLPLNSLEGHIAHTVYKKDIGDSVFRRSTPVVCILVWTDLCRSEPGEIIYKAVL